MPLSFKDISIKTKIIGLATILILLLLGSGSYALLLFKTIGDEITAISEENMPLTRVTTEITVNQLEQAINFERALRYGAEINSDNTYSSHFNKALSNFNELGKKLDKELVQGKVIAEEARELAYTSDTRKKFDHIDSLLINIEQQHKIYEQHAHEVFSEFKKGNMHSAFALAEDVQAEEDKIDRELKGLLTEIEEFAQAATLTVEHDEQRAFSTLSIVMVIGLIIGLFSALIIVRVISTGINKAVRISETIASGDLTQNIAVTSSDEIGMLLGALNAMQTKLKTMIMGMQQSAIELSASSEEMATVTEQTAKNIINEASEVEQTAAAIHEMTATVEEVAKNASATAESANYANSEALKGSQVVQQTIGSIQQLTQTIENSSTVIHQVGNDSQSIGGILDVIKGIAEQTNLLALNAAIEAARAGDQGRGFAVVADEVRTLAQRTQTSTHEIEEMIARLQSGAENAVLSMDSGQEQATISVEQAAKAGESLAVITTAVATINDMNTQIAIASEEQSTVAELINKSITGLNQISEQNATAMTEMASTTEEVARMAAQLQDLTCEFRV